MHNDWGRHVTQQLRHCLRPPHPMLECLLQGSILHFQSSFLLKHTQRGRQWWLKCLDPCHPHRRPRGRSSLPASFRLVQLWLLADTQGVNQCIEDPMHFVSLCLLDKMKINVLNDFLKMGKSNFESLRRIQDQGSLDKETFY